MAAVKKVYYTRGGRYRGDNHLMIILSTIVYLVFNLKKQDKRKVCKRPLVFTQSCKASYKASYRNSMAGPGGGLNSYSKGFTTSAPRFVQEDAENGIY